MGEALILSKALISPILQEIVKAKLTRNRRHQAENIPFILNRLSIKQLVEEGKGILDKGKGLDLEKIKNLAVKITLASHKSIDISRIPPLPDLLCLRLYGVCEEATLTFGEKGFKNLKKLVIGDMKILERVVIASAVIKAVATIKLCNLPQFKELVCLRTKLPLLRCSFEGKTNVPFKVVQSSKTIFLKGLDIIHVDKSPSLKLYHYDMDKQCYKEVIKPHDNQS